ncbi:ribosome biogenesis GTP-binding protein YihA/YsxC [Telmatospirillum siberiense]|uniref:ribosome biogenesis GTP-binding protein YihA/YsxC n=1 Tax=Telmatospirillum siberiense TaxID=382514 RepID=UPI00269933B6
MADHAPAGPNLTAPVTDGEEAARIEAGRLLFAKECGFVAGTATLARLPSASLPEVAFAGRSNVGKSSLINALTGRNGLARASNTPGRTQQINFFDLGRRLMLVDLPGYGYAQAPKNQVAEWNALVEAYLKGRTVLRRTCVLIDSRHGLKDSDDEVMTMLDKSAVNYQIVLTKADKIKPSALETVRAEVAASIAKRPAAHPEILSTSAESGLGIAQLRANLTALALNVALPETTP